jgi:tight adherence protein B
MRGLVRLAAAAFVAIITVALTAAGASAASTGHIVQIQQTGSTLKVVFAATGLPTGTSLDPTTVHVTIDGQTVPAKAEPLTSANDVSVNRTAILVIDTSGSMQGAGIAGARAAAKQFLRQVPADVRVGVVAVSGRPSVAIRPTRDHTAVAAAINQLNANGETALYDGVALALTLAGNSGPRNVVVLSDGADTTSHASLSAIERRIKSSKATVEAVGFRTSDAQSTTLRAIASSGGGHVITSAQASGLASAFAQAARDIAGQVLVSANLPAGSPVGSATIQVTAQAGSDTLTVSAFASLTSVSAPEHAPGAKALKVHTVKREVLLVGVLALFLGVVVLLAVAFAAAGTAGSESAFRRRLSIYTLTGRSARRRRETTALGDSDLAHSAVDLAGRVVASRGLEELLATKLDAAGVPLKPSEWLLVHVGIVVVLPPLLLIITGGNLLFGIIGAAVGGIGPWMYLSIKQSRRQAAFLAALPDTLQLLSGGLQAGYSLPQALDAVVREGVQPVAGEFNRALVETRLGASVEDALENVAQRIDNPDFRWVVMAIRIQREVGGNLAEVLTNVAATLRERERLRRQVQVLSAEGRLSAWILGSLPVLFAAYLTLVRRDYIKLLVTDPIGIVMLIILTVAMVAGILWLRKVVRVEV